MSASPPLTGEPPSEALRLPRLLSAGLEAAWASGLLSRPALDPETLLAEAGVADEAGLDADGREAFELLARDLQDSAQLNALGRTIAHGQLVAILKQRRRAVRLWRDTPQIFEQPLDAPVIVLGHMRSGTTRLQRMLACDPRFAFTRAHESLRPVSASRGRALASAAAVQQFLRLCNPQLARIHPTTPNAPEEEFGLHAFSFHGAMFEAQWNVPRFAAFSEERDPGPVYVEFRRLLQTLHWRRETGADKVQLLKAPQFMDELDAVLAAFPGARILWIRRDLEAVVASSASLVWNQQRIQSDAVDRRAIGQAWLRKTELREARTTEALRRLQPPVITVDYAAMSDDWRSEMRRIYAFLDFPLEPMVEARMERLAKSPAHRGHRYSPEQFGLD